MLIVETIGRACVDLLRARMIPLSPIAKSHQLRKPNLQQHDTVTVSPIRTSARCTLPCTGASERAPPQSLTHNSGIASQVCRLTSHASASSSAASFISVKTAVRPTSVALAPAPKA